MLRQYGKSFYYLHKAVDFSIAYLIWCFVYWFRFDFLDDGQQGLEVVFIKAGLAISFLTVYFFSKEGLYKSRRLSSRWEELAKITKANTFAIVSFVVFLYFAPNERLSRGVLIGYFLTSTICYVFINFTLRKFLSYMRESGRNLRHVLLIGHGQMLESYVTNIMHFREYGIKFVGWVDSHGAAKQFNIHEKELDKDFFNKRPKLDAIVIGYQGEDAAKVDKIIREIYNDVVPLIVLPDLSYALVGHRIDYLAGVPALIVNEPDFSTLDVLSKRVFDILTSGIGLICLSPLFFVIGILIRLSSPGPIFYTQLRVGLDGKKFKMLKFRSMRVDADNEGSVPGWTVKDDPRRTKIGSFIRRTSIDELPQLFNVFIGDMSLIGPRPEQPFYVEKFRREIPAYMLRHKMKAGITGWAQVNGWRGDTSLHKRIECDLYYIRNWSFWLDLKIIFLTFWRGFVNKNAY